MWREKAPRPTLPQLKKVQKLKAESPKLQRSNSDSSLASWQALSEISWQDVTDMKVADMEVDFEDMLLKLSDEDFCKLKDTVTQQLVDAERDLQDVRSLENDSAVVEEIKMMKTDCQKDLDAALPALDAAVKALCCLSKGDLGEVKAMKMPPAGVCLVCEALCIMFSVKPRKVSGPRGEGKVDDFWEAAKKELLGDPRLLEKMMSFDKDNIPDLVIQKVKPLCDREDFNPEAIKKASKAAQGICLWVHALVTYHQVAKEVAPKRAALTAAMKKLVCTDEILEAKRRTIQEMQEKKDLVEFEEARRKGEAAVKALQEVRAQKLQEQAKVDLEEAKPKLDALKESMQKALNGLHQKDLQELKCLCKPPSGVDDVAAVVAYLIKGKSLKKKFDWSQAQQMWANPGAFLLQMKAFDAKAPIPFSILQKIRAITRKEYFNVEAMRKKSLAAACLVDWALNAVEYNEVYQKVLPLLRALPQEPAVAAVPACEEQTQAISNETIAKADVQECLGRITKGDVQELKCLGKPPHVAVEVCIACAMLLKNVDEFDWKGCQKMMSDPGHFLKELQSVDIDKIPKAALSKCSRIAQQPFFESDAIRKVSHAAGSIAAWVICVLKYRNFTENYKGSVDQVKPIVKKAIVQNKDGNETLLGTSQTVTRKTPANLYLAKSDIVELKSLCKPPQQVMVVLHCVQILLDKDPDGGWAAGKRMLGDVTLAKTLFEYRQEDVTDAQRQRVQLLLESDVSLRDDNILKVSKAAYGLLRWVRAVVSAEVMGINTCPGELELDGELRTAVPTPSTTPVSTEGSVSNLNTPSATTEKNGMVHAHLSEAVRTAEADQPSQAQSIDDQSTEGKSNKCVIN